MPEDPSHEEVFANLERRGHALGPGLGDGEFDRIEERFGFVFPPDLRAFLLIALPTGDRWPPWRDPENRCFRRWFRGPATGCDFDVRHGLWHPEVWGPKPPELRAARLRVRDLVRAAPRLIPVYGHRYLPATPAGPGNPVFSVHQTDIILYGRNLSHHFGQEFFRKKPWNLDGSERFVPFWTPMLFSDPTGP